MICTRCHTENLAESDFYRDKRKPTGLSAYCKECHKSLSRTSYKTGERTEYLRIYRQTWRKERPEVFKRHKHKYRACKRGNGGSYSVNEWEAIKKKYNYTCPSCHRKEPEIKLTVDHIMPLSKGGSNNAENLQPLCKRCNSSKLTKTIRYSTKVCYV